MGAAYQIRNQNEAYFLTFTVIGWVDVFSRHVYRDIMLESLTYCRKKKGLLVFAYVIMSNHVHVICQSECGKLSDTIRDLKKYTAKEILQAIRENKQESRKKWLEMIFQYHAKCKKRLADLQFWTHANHAVELSNSKMIDTRLQYIHENPVRAGWVSRAEDYLYSSARNYAALDALMPIDLL